MAADSSLDALLLSQGAEALQAALPGFCALIPELTPMIGFDQRSPHHAYDLITHTLRVTAAVPPEPVLRWAALLHDVGKVDCFTLDAGGRGHFYDHARVGAETAERILRRLGKSDAFRERAVWLIRQHMTRLPADADALRALAEQHSPDALLQLIALQEADMENKGTDEHAHSDTFSRLRLLLAQAGAPQEADYGNHT